MKNERKNRTLSNRKQHVEHSIEERKNKTTRVGRTTLKTRPRERMVTPVATSVAGGEGPKKEPSAKVKGGRLSWGGERWEDLSSENWNGTKEHGRITGSRALRGPKKKDPPS